MRNDAHLVQPTAAFDTVAASDSNSTANFHAVSPAQSPEVSPCSDRSNMAAPLGPPSKDHLALRLTHADVNSSASKDDATERIEDAYDRLHYREHFAQPANIRSSPVAVRNMHYESPTGKLPSDSYSQVAKLSS
jgi:hypothetical protein